MTDEKPTPMALDLMRSAKAERQVRSLAGPRTLEERRIMRDAGEDSVAAMRELAEKVVRIRLERLNAAVALVAARCDDEEDFRKRVAVNEQERSRMRMPLYSCWLDRERVWEGGFEVVGEGQIGWQERWIVYPSADLPQHQRWHAEPRKGIVAAAEGGFCATIVRKVGDELREWNATGEDEESAVRACFAKVDA